MGSFAWKAHATDGNRNKSLHPSKTNSAAPKFSFSRTTASSSSSSSFSNHRHQYLLSTMQTEVFTLQKPTARPPKAHFFLQLLLKLKILHTFFLFGQQHQHQPQLLTMQSLHTSIPPFSFNNNINQLLLAMQSLHASKPTARHQNK